MTLLDERVATLEGRIEEQRMRTDDIREAVQRLEDRMDRRFTGLESRLDAMNRLVWGLLVAVATTGIAVIGGIVAALLSRK